ncbi:MAG TPA: hypothetical protein VH479_10490, partial [Acidimicrobiales bacterium]
MEFRLDGGQVELQQTVARFAESRFALTAVADPALWAGLAALGLFGLADLGPVEGVIVFEQLGRHLAPGPVLWTVLAAGLVDGASTGERRVGGVDATSVEDTVVGEGTVVVEHAGDLDVLLAVHDDRVVAHETAGLGEPEPLVPLDPLTPVGRYRGLGAGTELGDAEVAADLRRRGTLLTAAALAGVAGRALDVARAYALER